jgi:hypothetical protein
MKRTTSLFIILFSAVLMCMAEPAQADQPINLLRVLCIQEKGMPHFSLEVTSFAEAATYIRFGKNEGDTTTKKQRIDALRKYGLIYPQNFEYECVLPNATYRITGNEPPHRERGMCGGNPRLTVSLYHNGKALLKKVYMTPSCFTELFDEKSPYISKIVVDEAIEGWNSGWIWTTISNADEAKLLPLELPYGDESPYDVIENKYLNCIFESGLSKTQINPSDMKKCYK